MKEVERNLSSRTDREKSDWQLFGEFQLPIGSETDLAVTKWLTELLNPLDLQINFLDKVLKSALEAAARARQARQVTKFRHIHLVVFTPFDLKSNGNAWGFFRIDKIDSAEQNTVASDHAIEFYLYMEGQESNHST